MVHLQHRRLALGVLGCAVGPEPVGESDLSRIEFRSARWYEDSHIEIRYTQPDKPNQNAYIERFNRIYREEVPRSYLFEDLDEVREITWNWLASNNEERPHRKAFLLAEKI